MKHAIVNAALIVLTAWALMLVPRARAQEQGLPQPAEPTLSWTRHGEVVFEADVRPGGAPKNSRPMLIVTMEIAGVRKKKGWGEFTAAFFDATSRAWLGLIPSAASAKKGKITVALAIDHDGTLEAAPVVQHSSGDTSIDAATREAIVKSAPFKSLPTAYKKDAAQVIVTFAYDHPRVPSSGAHR
ncbi:MAG: energy transducer TonB [Candidatus Acidiferrales bacterium]